jgi:hypothetical protein
MVAKHAGGRLDRLWVKEAADDDAASVLPRGRVRPRKLVRDALAVGAQADMVDPAEAVKVIRGERGGHAVWWMLPAAD